MRMIAVTRSATCYFPISEEDYEKLKDGSMDIYDWVASEDYWREYSLDYRTTLTWEDDKEDE